MNTMFEESVRQSVTTLVWILAFGITDYSFWKYDQHIIFTEKMQFKQVSDIHFWV